MTYVVAALVVAMGKLYMEGSRADQLTEEFRPGFFLLQRLADLFYFIFSCCVDSISFGYCPSKAGSNLLYSITCLGVVFPGDHVICGYSLVIT